MPTHYSAVELPPAARAVLSGPDFVARSLAGRERDPQRNWILRRPRAVRRDFVETVVDGGGDEERWMLLQDDDTRHSYVREVLRRAVAQQDDAGAELARLGQLDVERPRSNSRWPEPRTTGIDEQPELVD